MTRMYKRETTIYVLFPQICRDAWEYTAIMNNLLKTNLPLIHAYLKLAL